ncbi:MAG: ccdA [Frankiales bacterium]|nr:ccdA [Frankiales bacterium]
MNAAGGFAGIVQDGSLLAAVPLAILVGVVGFLSPCVLPLVPGYLSFVAGLAGTDTARNARRQRRMVLGALLFVLGFTVIFIAEGALFGSLGSRIQIHRVAIERVMGVVTVAMGLVFLGRLPFLQREFKIHRLPRPGLVGAPLLGIAFGLAWTPCLTPTFSAVYTLAFSQGTAGRGAFLMLAYCLGLGVPFILVALGLGWVTGGLAMVRRHARLVGQLGGALLIVFGLALVTGVWDHWAQTLTSHFGGTGAGVSI